MLPLYTPILFHVTALGVGLLGASDHPGCAMVTQVDNGWCQGTDAIDAVGRTDTEQVHLGLPRVPVPWRTRGERMACRAG